MAGRVTQAAQSLKCCETATRKAYQLIHQGCIALSQVEANGMRVDVGYLDRAMKGTAKQISRLESELKSDDIFQTWKQRFREKTNLGSRYQLGVVLFQELEIESPAKTPTGRPKVDEYVLASLGNPFTDKYIKLEKLKKVRNTYLKGIQRELQGDRIHPVFNLHMVKTYRSSSDSPNFQNLPIRDPQQGKIIRKCFIPSPGHVLVEVDYSAIEVRVAACYHKDPVMLEYIEDPTKDMHRDMAAQCYKISEDAVTKPMRHAGKNKFVFPQFYGDYYINCARNLWEDSKDFPEVRENFPRGLGLCDPERLPIPGTFEAHIRGVEQDFWKRRFQVYGQWKINWWKKYLKTGYFRMKTGFLVSGVYARNEVTNFPIQGSSFHCLLWSLIQLQQEIRRKKMKTKIVGQIHDSIVADVPEKELSDYIEMIKRIMTQDIRKEWKWIITPFDVEAEVSATNWYEKKEYTSGSDSKV